MAAFIKGDLITERSVRAAFSAMVDEGEKIESVRRGFDMMGRPHALAVTDRRALFVKLSKSFELKSTKAIPLARLDKKLKGFERLDGLKLVDARLPTVASERERSIYELAVDSLTKLIEQGEAFTTVGLCREKEAGLATSFLYVVLTDKRIVFARLSDKREVQESEGVPLSDIADIALFHGSDRVPLDTPLFASQELILHVDYKGGRQRRFLVTDLFGHRREDAVY